MKHRPQLKRRSSPFCRPLREEGDALVYRCQQRIEFRFAPGAPRGRGFANRTQLGKGQVEQSLQPVDSGIRGFHKVTTIANSGQTLEKHTPARSPEANEPTRVRVPCIDLFESQDDGPVLNDPTPLIRFVIHERIVRRFGKGHVIATGAAHSIPKRLVNIHDPGNPRALGRG